MSKRFQELPSGEELTTRDVFSLVPPQVSRHTNGDAMGGLGLRSSQVAFLQTHSKDIEIYALS